MKREDIEKAHVLIQQERVLVKCCAILRSKDERQQDLREARDAVRMLYDDDDLHNKASRVLTDIREELTSMGIHRD